jgi:formylglycine-generating enzyme required for sulfatase activity
MPEFDLFVSHASVDHQAAMSIVVDLEAKGIRCWIAPRDIPIGSAYQVEIVNALEHCRAILLVFSDAANKSEHILREVELAAQGRKPIYPLRIDPTIPTGGLRYLLANKQWVERQTLGDRLVATIAQLLSTDGVVAAGVGELAAKPVPPAPKTSKLPILIGAGAAIVIAAGVAVWFAVRPVPPLLSHDDLPVQPPPKTQPVPPKEPPSQVAAPGADIVELPPPVAAAAPANAGSLGPGVHLFRDCDNCPVMAVIPAGQGVVGSPPSEPGRQSNEGPQQKISIGQPFAVARSELSFDEWLVCVAEGGCNAYRPGDYGWGYGQNPAINVSWNDAEAYVDWLSKKTGARYRLLSEAEWEYAARGCSKPCGSIAFWFGQTIAPERANYDWRLSYEGSVRAQALRRTVSADRGAANPFGLVHVSGNVSEWVQDCWNESLAGLPPDGSARSGGDCQRHVLRGGSWSDEPKDLRSAARAWELATERRSKVGFRVARNLDH